MTRTDGDERHQESAGREPAVVEVAGSMIRFRPDRTIEATPRDLGGDDTGGWTLTEFEATDDASVHADTWERHTLGDELVMVLSGSVAVEVRGRTGEQTLVAGSAAVVPKGAWHRLRVLEPARLVSITPRAGTRREPRGSNRPSAAEVQLDGRTPRSAS